jgi:hypothetical protein
MKTILLKFIFLAAAGVIAAAPCSAQAGVIKPSISWTDSTDVIAPPVGTGFITFSSFGPQPGDGREQAGFTGTFFSTVDAQTFGTGVPGDPFGPASVWMVEPGSNNTLSDWIGIDSLSRVGVTGGWLYTIDMRFVSDPIEGSGGSNNIPDPPTTPPFDPYPFVTETGLPQDITGNFNLTNFPGYLAPPGLVDLITITVASDVNEAGGNGGNGNGVPDGGTAAMLFAVALCALAVARKGLATPRVS